MVIGTPTSFSRDVLPLQLSLVGSIKTIDHIIPSSELYNAMVAGVNYHLSLDKVLLGDLGVPHYFTMVPLYKASNRTDSPYVFNVINILSPLPVFFFSFHYFL
jgi:hypothetical protein